MARKGKNSRKSKKVLDEEAVAVAKTSNDDLVDDDPAQDNDDEPEESWDVLPGMDRETLERFACRSEECMRDGRPVVAIWVSNQNPDDHWPLCETCTKRDFGPDTIIPEPPPPLTSASSSSSSISPSEESKVEEKEAVADGPPPEETAEEVAEEPADEVEEREDDDSEKDNDDEEDPELWTLTKVLPVQAIQHEAPIKCQTEDCTLLAATAWVSNRNPTHKWYTCLDCQEQDFEGWPDLCEIPIQSMTREHKDLLIAKCSSTPGIAMPGLPEQEIINSDDNDKENEENMQTDYIDDQQLQQSSPYQTNPFSCEADTIPNPISHSIITPPPNSLPRTTTALMVTTTTNAMGGHKKGSTKSTITPSTTIDENHKKSSKPTKAQLEIHKQWRDAAEKMGGAKIVVNKMDAKKIIFDYLSDSFQPMTITQIYNGLKAVVPSPILKACLDDMALDDDPSEQFADSDDDDDDADGKPKKKAKPQTKKEGGDLSSDPYKKSLTLKHGKSLYYVNYSTAKNGDGLSFEERNKLAADFAKAQLEAQSLEEVCKSTHVLANQLLSEPTNEEATVRLESEESELQDLQEQLEAARKLKHNEKHKQQLKRAIDYYTTTWRSRKRICLEFLINMEDLSEGTISRKKCLAGDGPIDMDSDEAVSKAAVEYAKKSKNQTSAHLKKGEKAMSCTSGIPPSESFVAVLLTSQGTVERVHWQN